MASAAAACLAAGRSRLTLLRKDALAYMKHVVVSSGLREEAIRPPSLMSEFKRLSIEEAYAYFIRPGRLTPVDCPACGGVERKPVFDKEGFIYNKCRDCNSVYVSPRPTHEALADYYRESRASHYRVEQLAKDTAGARRAHLLRSHANWVGRVTDEQGNIAARSFTDTGTSLAAIFDEFKRLGLFDALNCLDPLPALADEIRAMGVTVTSEPPQNQGAVTAFEQIEHQFSPLTFLENAREMLTGGGLVFFTTRTISGFDLQMLWEKTPYIFVPEHLNLLSIEGIEELVRRSGFDLIELSTPGQLDVELTIHAAQQDPSIALPHFIEYLLKHRGTQAHEDFQEFLQKARLSSHVRVAAARRKAMAP